MHVAALCEDASFRIIEREIDSLDVRTTECYNTGCRANLRQLIEYAGLYDVERQIVDFLKAKIEP